MNETLKRKIAIIVDMDAKMVGKTVSDIESAFGRLRGTAVKAFKYLSIGAAAVGAGLVYVAKQVLDTGMQFERFRIQLKVLYGSAAAGERAFAWIKKFAVDTPFEIDEITNAFIKLKAVGMAPTKDNLLRDLGDLASATQKPLEQVVQAIQSIASGLTGLGMRQLRQLLITNQDLEKYGVVFSKQGQVISNNLQMIRAVQKVIADKHFQGMMAETLGSVTQLLSNISDLWTQIKAEFAKALFPIIQPDLAKIQDYLTNLIDSGKLRQWARQFADAFKQAYDKAKEWLPKIWETAKQVAIELWNVFEKVATFLVEHPGAVKTALIVVVLTKALLLARDLYIVMSGIGKLTAALSLAKIGAAVGLGSSTAATAGGTAGGAAAAGGVAAIIPIVVGVLAAAAVGWAAYRLYHNIVDEPKPYTPVTSGPGFNTKVSYGGVSQLGVDPRIRTKQLEDLNRAALIQSVLQMSGKSVTPAGMTPAALTSSGLFGLKFGANPLLPTPVSPEEKSQFKAPTESDVGKALLEKLAMVKQSAEIDRQQVYEVSDTEQKITQIMAKYAAKKAEIDKDEVMTKQEKVKALAAIGELSQYEQDTEHLAELQKIRLDTISQTDQAQVNMETAFHGEIAGIRKSWQQKIDKIADRSDLNIAGKIALIDQNVAAMEKDVQNTRLNQIADYGQQAHDIEVNINKLENQTDEAGQRLRLTNAEDYINQRIQLDQQYQDLKNGILNDEVLTTQQKLDLIANLQKDHDKNAVNESVKAMQRRVIVASTAYNTLSTLANKWAAAEISTQKYLKTVGIQLAADEVAGILQFKAKEWSAKAIAAAAEGQWGKAAGLTAAAIAAGAAASFVEASAQRTIDKITKETAVPTGNEALDSASLAAQTRGGTTTRGIQNMYVQPSVAISGNTVIVGDTDLQTASTTIGNIAVKAIKDAIETGEISLAGAGG
jgi:hypothetical protein